MRNYIMCINILLTAFQWHMVRRSATETTDTSMRNVLPLRLLFCELRIYAFDRI